MGETMISVAVVVMYHQGTLMGPVATYLTWGEAEDHRRRLAAVNPDMRFFVETFTGEEDNGNN